MIISGLHELILYPVANRGIPNIEHIPIQVAEPIEINRYGIMLGHSNPDGGAMPYNDNLYWFGGGSLKPGDWILLYTGNGEPRTDEWNNPPGSVVYSIHWGRSNTLFANSLIVPILFRTDEFIVGQQATDVPQLNKQIKY